MSNEKKRKRHEGPPPSATTSTTTPVPDLNTSKPSAIFKPRGGRPWTLSVALPGSIINNAQSPDLKTQLCGQIGRALAVFSVDEIVIFNDGTEGPESTRPIDPDEYTGFSHPSHFLEHVLSFLETPPNLRKALFPTHSNLKAAGTLPSLDMPHHLKTKEKCEYREGVVVDVGEAGSYIDVGLAEPRVVEDVKIPLNTRVTVQLGRGGKKDEVVAPSEPREAMGYYWGYTVRQCKSLSTVLTECPFDGGYDLSIGTSERGKSLADIALEELPQFQHLLVVFGGVAGLETAAANDPELEAMGIAKTNVGDLYDLWVNVLPGQGSRTIRTEEALWLGLMGTRRLVENR